jgi:hypothetical protein
LGRKKTLVSTLLIMGIATVTKAGSLLAWNREVLGASHVYDLLGVRTIEMTAVSTPVFHGADAHAATAWPPKPSPTANAYGPTSRGAGRRAMTLAFMERR